jgi:multiple sugar transport system permease protein
MQTAGDAAHRAYVGDDESRERSYRRLTSRVTGIISAAWLGLLLLFLLFPFYWVIMTSFKSSAQVRTMSSPFWPSPWTIENYSHMLVDTDFPRWFWNTVQVAAVSTMISVSVAALGAYALVRLRWRGAGMIQTAILFAYLMPTVMLFIPLYQIFTNLKLINTLGALMIAYPTFGLPFACWLLMGYYRSIPKDLEEAALIDGANHFQCFIRIVLPLTLPALLAVALFAVTSAWNEFLLAFVLVAPESSRTLPVGLGNMVVGDIFPFGQMFAASVMTAIPVTIIYMTAQRFMVEGLTAGSVKG